MSFVADGSGAYDQLLLPFATVDGINDAGVCVQVTMPGEETYDIYMENYGEVYYNSALWDEESAIKGDISKAGIIAPRC